MEQDEERYYQDALLRPPVKRKDTVSKNFAYGLAVIAVLIGFSFGAVYTRSTAAGGAPLYDEDTVTALYNDASPAVVEVRVVRRVGTLQISDTGTGSGFLVDDGGHIITNHHVIESADEFLVKLSDGRTVDAELLGASPADDLALLRVDPEEVADIEPLQLADSGEVSPGQLAVAIGSPFRQFNSVTVGVVSGTGRGPISELRRPIPDMIQTDAPLNPGNSGGPLLNSDGEVIGVASAVRTATFQQIEDFRIGFAVPSNTVKDLMPQLVLSQEIRRPWLGISGGPISPDLADTLGISKGIVVTSVFTGSPAADAELVPFRSLSSRGDVITAVDDETVASVEDMVSYFNSHRPGDEVTLSVLRDGREMKVDVTLAEWPDS